MMKRLWLFLRDWIGEWPIAWSIARTYDCGRSGGHRWGTARQDAPLSGWWRECSRCGCAQSVSLCSVITTNASTIWIDPSSISVA